MSIQFLQYKDRFTGAEAVWPSDWIDLVRDEETVVRMFPLSLVEGPQSRILLVVVLMQVGIAQSLDGKLMLLGGEQRLDAVATPIWVQFVGNAANQINGPSASVLPPDLVARFTSYFRLHSSMAGHNFAELRAFEVPAPDLFRVLDAAQIAIRVATRAVNLDFDIAGNPLHLLRSFATAVAGAQFATPISAPASACLPGDASVLTPSGACRLDQCVRGGYVLSWNVASTTLVPRRVTRVLSHSPAPTLIVEFGDGLGPLEATPNHRVLTAAGKWPRVDRLSGGDVLVSCLGQARVVDSVRHSGRVVPVFNLHTEVDHNFIASGLIVHNFSVLRALRTNLHRVLFDHLHLIPQVRRPT